MAEGRFVACEESLLVGRRRSSILNRDSSGGRTFSIACEKSPLVEELDR